MSQPLTPHAGLSNFKFRILLIYSVIPLRKSTRIIVRVRFLPGSQGLRIMDGVSILQFGYQCRMIRDIG